jgi:potassium-dependent mechanosensitive channel
VTTLLRALDRELTPGPQVARIEQDLPALIGRLDLRVERTRQALASGADLGALDTLADLWRSSRLGLAAWVEMLTARATWLEQQRAGLANLSDTWTRTRKEARAAKAPAAIFQRTADVLAAIAETQERVEAQRVATLVLQDRVARELSRCEDALAQTDQARQRAVGDLFVRESPPIWKVHRNQLSQVPGLLGPALEAQLEVLRRFAAEHVDRLVLHALIVLALTIFLWRAKRRAAGLATSDTAARSLAFLFDQPVAAALLLGLLSGVWIYGDEARMGRLTVEIGALVPLLLIIRRVVTPVVRPALYALTAFYLVDLLRDLVLVLPLIERVLFLVETFAAMLLLALFVRSGRVKRLLDAHGTSALGRAQAMIFGLAAVGFCVAFVSGVIGNMSLARLLGSGILNSGYLALILAAGRRMTEGLVAFALRVRPLTLLHVVERHRAHIEWRANVTLRSLSFIAWVVGVFSYFSLLTPAIATARKLFGARLTVGALSISLGDVGAFAATLYLAFLVSSIVRYTLEEDVFPRFTLKPGLPYALSSLIRYAIVFAGFLMALAALGLNLDRLTVLGGALGLGVGFGLQNIVNNFVSGLIVLFERPVRVGDAVQVGDVLGEVRRIGIRSSTVRTFEGADVIVPNSQLVSERVTNWTPFDQRRRLEIQVNVAYGSAPDAVLKLLGDVARSHPDVLAQPAPVAVFLGFGDSALRFQLWSWTARIDRHVAVKSELGIAVYAALSEAGFSIPLPQAEVRLYPAAPPAPAVPPAPGQNDQPTPIR